MGAFKLDYGDYFYCTKKCSKSNHLGNVLTLFTDKKIPVGTGNTVSYYKADLVSSMDYSPFGAPLKGRTFNANKSRVGFGNHEKDNEVDGDGNTYDFGGNGYDARLGRRKDLDPKAKETPYLSAYSTFLNNPTAVIDEDGNSGVSYLDSKTRTITVKSTLYFSGSGSSSGLAKQTAGNIQKQWNAVAAKISIDGVEYSVKYQIVGVHTSTAAATIIAKKNGDNAQNNFITVSDMGKESSRFQLSGNAGDFNTKDDVGKSTTPAHEFGHGLGLEHEEGGKDEKDSPDIMTPRESTVHPKWALKGSTKNEIDPNTRKVKQKNVSDTFKGVKFDKQGKANIGKTTNKIYPETK